MFNRHVILDRASVSCGLRVGPIKSVSHLFVTCRVMINIWYKIFRWFGRLVILLGDSSHFEFLSSLRVWLDLRGHYHDLE